ncbi:MAG: lasso peptide biosynthesis B2 protein [Pseudomonadota bacterium]
MPHLYLKAVWELARARASMGSIKARDIMRLNEASKAAVNLATPSEGNANLVSKVGFLVTFAARHLPWRSDCLPQALAAQRWLLAEGIGSEIRIGVERPDGEKFGAHAWLIHGDQIVTGGEINHFAVLLGEETSS